ncbi:MAG: helix-turn-helix transcriptional regulator [Acidobacteriaceae bacterium]
MGGKLIHVEPESFEKSFYLAFGLMLAVARKKRRISQEMLAEELGLTRTSITNIEKGRQPVQLHTLYVIARLLSIDLKELLPSPQSIDIPDQHKGLNVSRSEWLKQMNVTLPGGEANGKSKVRSNKTAGE